MEEKTKTLVSLSIAQLLATLIWYNYSAVLPILKTEWNLTGTMAGAILASFQAGYVISVLATGYLTDRVGGAKTFAICACETGLCGLAFAFLAKDFFSALVLRGLAGIGQGGLYVPGMKILSSCYPPKERGMALGVYTCSLVGAYAGAYYIAGPIAVAQGWRIGIFWTSIWAFPAALIAYFSAKGMSVSPAKGQALDFRTFKKGVLENRAAALVTIAYLGHMWELYAMWGWIGPYIDSCARVLGYSRRDALFIGTTVAATMILMGGFSPAIGGLLSDKLGRPKSIVLIMLSSIPCSLVYGWLIGMPLWILVTIGLFYGFVVVADSAIYKAALTELVPGEMLGSALGLQSFLGFGATILSTAAFGVVLDLTNAPLEVSTLGYFPRWGWAFAMLGTIALVGPFSALLLMRLKR